MATKEYKSYTVRELTNDRSSYEWFTYAEAEEHIAERTQLDQATGDPRIMARRYAIEQQQRLTAHELAVRHIRAYVERGDSLADIRAGQSGSSGGGHTVSIGGFINGKSVGTGYIVISRLNGEDCAIAFKLKDIYDEIKFGQRNFFEFLGN